MKKVLIISSSPRKNSNSQALCTEFFKGAQSAGNEAELIRLADRKIGYCTGCYACTRLGKCIQNDDMNDLAAKMEHADVIVLATPVYFYTLSGQLKVFIDRMVQNYTKIRADIYIFATAWDSNTEDLEETVEAIRGFSRDCLKNCPEKGVLLVGGVTEEGTIKGRKELAEAYQMGVNC